MFLYKETNINLNWFFKLALTCDYVSSNYTYPPIMGVYVQPGDHKDAFKFTKMKMKKVELFCYFLPRNPGFFLPGRHFRCVLFLCVGL